MNASQRGVGMRFAAYVAATLTALAGTVLVSAPAQAATIYDALIGGVNYEFTDGSPNDGARVTSYTPDPGQTAVTILANVNFGAGGIRPVRGINSGVFAYESALAAVHFEGNNLNDIGTAAFLQTNIGETTLPNSVTFIGQEAFSNISWKHVTIPNSVTFIGPNAFYDGLVESVVIGDHVTTIGSGAFASNGNLSSVRFLGPAPTTITPATTPFSDPGDSFETNVSDTMVVHFPSVYASQYGYPTWKSYKTMKGLAPTIAGNPREGNILAANTGTLVPPEANPTTFSYQWYANGAPIGGANGSTLGLTKTLAGRQVSVAIKSTSPGPDTETQNSAAVLVSSPYKRLVLSSYVIHKGQGLTVTATGLKPNQKYKIQLNKKTRASGRADAFGTVSRTVTFKSNTKSGKRTVKVIGSKAKHVKKYSASTKVRYYK